MSKQYKFNTRILIECEIKFTLSKMRIVTYQIWTGGIKILNTIKVYYFECMCVSSFSITSIMHILQVTLTAV